MPSNASELGNMDGSMLSFDTLESGMGFVPAAGQARFFRTYSSQHPGAMPGQAFSVHPEEQPSNPSTVLKHANRVGVDVLAGSDCKRNLQETHIT